MENLRRAMLLRNKGSDRVDTAKNLGVRGGRGLRPRVRTSGKDHGVGQFQLHLTAQFHDTGGNDPVKEPKKAGSCESDKDECRVPPQRECDARAERRQTPDRHWAGMTAYSKEGLGRI